MWAYRRSKHLFMKDKAGWMLSARRQRSGFSAALFIFHIGGGLTPSCNEDGSHGLLGVLGQCLATVSLDHRAATLAPNTATVCSDLTWTVKVKPCWHICVFLPEANSYYICLLFSGGRGSWQESNADSWQRADSLLTAGITQPIFSRVQ